MKLSIAILVTQILTTIMLVYMMIELYMVVDDLYEETHQVNAFAECVMKQVAIKNTNDDVLVLPISSQ